MTARLHHEEKQDHGGLRRGHIPPAMTDEQVSKARQDYAQGICYKLMARTYGVSRETLSRAIHGRRGYGTGQQKPRVTRGRRVTKKAQA